MTNFVVFRNRMGRSTHRPSRPARHSLRRPQRNARPARPSDAGPTGSHARHGLDGARSQDGGHEGRSEGNIRPIERRQRRRHVDPAHRTTSSPDEPSAASHWPTCQNDQSFEHESVGSAATQGHDATETLRLGGTFATAGEAQRAELRRWHQLVGQSGRQPTSHFREQGLSLEGHTCS